jgi:8-oxo-dGTP pyrophosphatase MutT (NUDIX family)
MDWAPHVTVATIVEQDGRFLLVEERTEDGPRFNQPAGHLERDESLLAAAVRETLEETAYSIELRHLVGIYRWDHPSRDLAYLRFAFAGRVLAHHPERPLDHGILRAVWLTPDEIREQAPRHRSPLVLRCLEDHLSGRRHGLELLHHVA